MCLDTKTSIITLTIGTVLNIWNIYRYRHEPTIIAISLLWQWVLLMQLFEAIAWQNQPGKNGICNSTNTMVAKLAYLANVSQPIILGIVMFTLTSSNITLQNKILSSVVLISYILWLLYATNKAPEVKCLTPTSEISCQNLYYNWWGNFPGNAMIYMITLVSLILLMVRPLNFAMMQLSYIILTFVVSAIFYSCGIGSIWCLLAAFSPILVGPMWEFANK